MLILKAPQSEVIAVVKRVADVAPARSPLAILSNVLVSKAGASVTLTTSDLDAEAVATGELGGDDGDFATTVSVKRLRDVLSTMPADQVVSITEKAGKLTVQGGRSRFTVGTLPAEDFPRMAADVSVTTLTLSQKTLRRMLHQVAFAMAIQDVRHYLNGALLQVVGGMLALIASDGSHIAEVKSPIDAADCSVILTRASVTYLAKAIADVDEPMTVRLGANHAEFVFGGQRFLTKLISGRFPDFERAIPKNAPHAVVAGREPLLQALQAAAVMTTLKFRGVRLQFAPGLLKFIGRDVGGEEAEREVDIDYDGPEFVIGFNAKLLAEGLSSIDADMVRMRFTDGSCPLMLTYVDDAAAYRYVVMPMRI